MSTEPFKRIDIKMSFLMNHASIRGTMTAAFIPEVVPFLQGIPGVIFQQDNASLHVAVFQLFCSSQHKLLLPWPAYSPAMSSIEHVCDLVGWHLARDPSPAASKDELLLPKETT
ncbi:transposable element Tcb2 transposase [Trichonephila clavipes]|nr:transposable element Tcb2 transposase [Trichonephila clavipes]